MQLWDDVDAYISELFVGDDAALDETLRASDAAGLPPIAVAPNQGKFLCILARLIDPKTKDERVQAVRRFNEIVANDKRVEATILQTVGTKGYDGLAFALVVGDS